MDLYAGFVGLSRSEIRDALPLSTSTIQFNVTTKPVRSSAVVSVVETRSAPAKADVAAGQTPEQTSVNTVPASRAGPHSERSHIQRISRLPEWDVPEKLE